MLEANLPERECRTKQYRIPPSKILEGLLNAQENHLMVFAINNQETGNDRINQVARHRKLSTP